MKLTILGSGTYQPELERHGSAYLIETDNSKICFDFGRGAIEQLLKVGVHVNQIDAVFITHWHSDHISDLMPLLQITISPPADYGFWPVRKKPLQIYGPQGTLDKIKAMVGIIHEGPELKNLTIKELKDDDMVSGQSWQVKTFLTIHNPNINPLCYRLEAEGKVFAYSGDTIKSEGLKRAIKDANLAVIEAGWPDEVQPKTHFTGSRAGKFAQEMGVKKLVITHMAPIYMKNHNPQKDAESTFGQEVILAKDLMKIEICL